MVKMYIDIENRVFFDIIKHKNKSNNPSGNSYMTITDGVNVDDEIEIRFDGDKYLGSFPSSNTGLVDLMNFFISIVKDTYNIKISEELLENQTASRLVVDEMYQRGSHLLSVTKNLLQNNTEFIYKEESIKQVIGTIRKD